MFKHILIATDGSELAERAAAQGLELAKVINAKVTVVTATEPWSAVVAGEAALAFPYGDYEKAAAENAVKILARAADMARKAEVACTTVHVKDQFPAEGIVAAAKDKGCDLIVMASHGSDGFGPPFMRGKDHDGMGPGMKGMEHGPGMMKGMGPRIMHGGAGQTFADPARMYALKAELAITSAQEPAWAKYAKAVQDAAASMKTARESVDPDVVSKMTPADRFAFVSKRREQGQTQFDAVKGAAEELLATLDATQKAKAIDILQGLAFGPGQARGAFAGNHQHRHGRDR